MRIPYMTVDPILAIAGKAPKHTHPQRRVAVREIAAVMHVTHEVNEDSDQDTADDAGNPHHHANGGTELPKALARQ